MILLQQYKQIWYGYDQEHEGWIIATTETGLNSIFYEDKYYRIDQALSEFYQEVLEVLWTEEKTLEEEVIYFTKFRHCPVDYD